MKLPLQAVNPSIFQSETKRKIPDISPYFFTNNKYFILIGRRKMNIDSRIMNINRF